MPQTAPTVADLLAREAQFGLTLLAGPAVGPPIERVTSVPNLLALEHDDPKGSGTGTVVVVLDASDFGASGYETDVAIRHAARRGTAAVVLVGARELPLTSRHLAERAHLPVLCADTGQDGTELLLHVDRYLRGGADETLARAQTAIQLCGEAAEADSPDPVAAVLAAASEALGCGVSVSYDSPVEPTSPAAVVVGEQAVAEVVTEVHDEATRVAVPAVAALVSRLRQRELNRRFAPAMTRAELIVQMVLSERMRLPQLTEQAYHAGLPVQRTHVAAWLRVETADGQAASPVEQRRLLADLELTALQMLHDRPGMWHVASMGGALLVLCSTQDPGARLYRRVREEVGHLLAALRETGGAVLTAGMGTPQPGAEGIRQSAAEARVAADSAAAVGRHGEIADTDPSGLNRILADVYSSPLSRSLLAELLAPLDELDADRARTAVVTLAAFLDAQGSPTRAARSLHLHPNAVSYRLRWILDALDLDLDDADTRFALQLACRVRLLES